MSTFSTPGPAALVTGAAGSLGTVIVGRLIADGWRVGCLDINAAGLEGLLGRTPHQRGQMMVRCCDVADTVALSSAVTELVADLGGSLAGLVNAAMRWQRRGDLTDVAITEWDDDMKMLLGGYRLVVAAAAGHLAPGSSVVNLSSVHGMVASTGWGSYDVAKAAILQLTRVFSYELGARRIRVNTVSPGIIAPNGTDLYRHRPELRELHAAASTLRTVGRPSDVAGAVAFLLGQDSRFITGHNLVVDGGMTSMLQLTALEEYARTRDAVLTAATPGSGR